MDMTYYFSKGNDGCHWKENRTKVITEEHGGHVGGVRKRQDKQ